MVDPALQQYVQTQSPAAFKALVDQHGGGVYAQCLRQLRDKHLAEDVTQAVFLVLARKARSLPADVVLPAWLFKVTRYACSNALRTQARRAHHEREVAIMNQQNLHSQHPHQDSPGDLELMLDDALARLGRSDRQAIILRYYSGMDTAEVGQSLGLSAESARRRISRAVAKLRDILARRGVPIAPAVLVGSLDALPRPPIPADLGAKILTHALDPSAAGPVCNSIAKGVIHMLRWTQIKIAAALGMLVVALGAGGAALSAGPEHPSAQAQATTASTMAADPAAVVDAESVERQLIRTALQRAAQAIRSHDREALHRCMVLADNPDGALLSAMMDENLAVRRLQDAWVDMLKQPMKFPDLTFVWVPQFDGGAEVVLEKTLENLNDADIRISGDHARVPLRLAPEPPRGQPDQFAFWRGWQMSLVRDGPLWKVDMNNTFRVNTSMTFREGMQPTSNADSQRIAIEQKQKLAAILDSTAALIEGGKIRTPAAAVRRVEGDFARMSGEYGLTGITYQFQPAAPRLMETSR
ncbi:MAG TPA: sigma-70 family RNA polymerase sigma factor [Tepidisphaeraceae bacterium]|jgi:RNA polymerase sigma factor (sigma-70 family)